MAENKTKPTKSASPAFLKKAATGQQLKDSQELVKLFKELTGKPAKMWGPSIVGFDSYHYVYESGREGDAPVIGFSPRKSELVLYLAPYLDDKASWRSSASTRPARVVCTSGSSTTSIARCSRSWRKVSIAELRKRYPPDRARPSVTQVSTAARPSVLLY